MNTSGHSFESGSNASSLVSPISLNATRTRSNLSFDLSDPNSENHGWCESHSGESDGSGHRILEGRSSGSSRSSTGGISDYAFARKSDESGSHTSGITIYSDAQETLEDEMERIQEHLQSPEPPQNSRTNSGLVAVTPLRSNVRDSFISSNGHDISGGESVNIPSLPPNNQLGYGGGASTTSFISSPSTPRLRRSPQRDSVVITEPSLISVTNPVRPLSATMHHDSPLPKRKSNERIPLAPIENKLRSIKPPARKSHTRSASSRGGGGGSLNLVLGKPRKPSPSTSVASTHASSQASSDGHIEPNRCVKGTQLSYIRRVGETMYTKEPIYAGIPRVPNFPSEDFVHNGAFPSSPHIGYNRDVWGRSYASWKVSILLLFLCTAFPPLWILLGTGYFDHLVGTIPRVIKLIALALAMLTLAAGTALVVIFPILGHNGSIYSTEVA